MNSIKKYSKAYPDKIISILTILLFTASLSIYAIQHIIIGPYYQQSIIITIISALMVAIWFYRQEFQKVFNFIVEKPGITIIFGGWTYCIQFYTFQSKNEISRANLHILRDKLNLFSLFWYIFAGIFLFFFLIYFFHKLGRLIRSIFWNIGKEDMIILFFIYVFLFLIVSTLYLNNSNMYYQMDNVYSVDSKWVWQGIFSDVNYYDLRHPIITELFFPIWAGINGLLKSLGVNSLRLPITLIFIQMINIFCILTVGVIIGKLSKNKMVALLYIVSMPTLLYFLSFEKCQIPLFFIVLYVYDSLNNRESIGMELILTAGFNPVFGIIWINELFSTKDKWISIVKRICKYVFALLLVIICTGRGLIFFFDNLIQQFDTQTVSFRTTCYSVIERLFGIGNLYANCLLSLDSYVTDPYIWLGDGQSLKISYTWMDVNASITFAGIIIILITLFGIWIARKEKFYKICSIWLILPFFMFLIMNLVPFETPLFAIFFSWALIPLFVKGLDQIIEFVKISKKIAYGIVCGIVGSINIMNIIQIVSFLYSIKDI